MRRIHSCGCDTGKVERIDESVGSIASGNRIRESSSIVAHDRQPVSAHGLPQPADGPIVGVLEARPAERHKEAVPSPKIGHGKRTGAAWQENGNGPAGSEHSSHLGETVIERVEQHEGHRAGNSCERLIVEGQVMGLAGNDGVATFGAGTIAFCRRSIEANPGPCPSRPQEGCTAASKVEEIRVRGDQLQRPLVRVLSCRHRDGKDLLGDSRALLVERPEV